MKFHVVLTDELGEEFGALIEAKTYGQAYLELRESYPESNVVHMESLEDTLMRFQPRFYYDGAPIADDDYGDPIFEDDD